MTLTASQQRTYDFIRDYIAREGFSPSYREIAEGCGITSTSTVVWRLESLAAAGLIRHKAFSPRAIQILPREAA